MKNKYIVTALIAAIIAVILFGLFINFKASQAPALPILPEIESVTETPEPAIIENQATTEPLPPLPVDESQAITSEIDAIDAELEALTDDSLDDLSDIENTF